MRELTIIALIAVSRVSTDITPSCDSPIYCQGQLLDTIQTARLFNDSKTFVDLIQINSPNITLENFENLMNTTSNQPTKTQLKEFLQNNFLSEGELEDWKPTDYNSNPAFLKDIDDIFVREFARTIIGIWPQLGKKVKNEVRENPDKHSLIPVPNGFIVPGGRFKELYYWDSYWIIKGLLLSEMRDTARGMLENFLSLVQRYGFVPNGSRVYYLNRSQPPLLSLMVGLYVDATDDMAWLKENIGVLEEELQWWLENRVIDIDRDGVKYTLAHYASESGTPRPESYREDVSTCAVYDESGKENCYKNLKSGAESGWDFSTRWIFDSRGGIDSNLTDIQPRRVVPVDLNSYICRAFKEMSRFYQLLGNEEKSIQWLERSSSWQKSIELVLYDRIDGIWYDYDAELQQPRKLFFPSNFAPLWAESYDTSFGEEYGSRAAKYFIDQKLDDYMGGIPTSQNYSGEQWDFPNAWPPLQETVILGLRKSGSTDAAELAETLARRWVNANIRGYGENKEMFEKFDARTSGKRGEGGEYTVQSGFGWTNGVALSIINHFYVNDGNKYNRARHR